MSLGMESRSRRRQSGLRNSTAKSHRRRLQWADIPSDEQTASSIPWECAPDQHIQGAANATRTRKNILTAEAANLCCKELAPGGILRLRCADGHLFDAEISDLWSSSVVRALVQDSATDDDFPLPGTRWQSAGAFLQLCSRPKQDLGSLLPVGTEHECLRELLWVARLLDMEHILGEALASYLNRHAYEEEHLYCNFRASELFTMLRASARGLSDSVLSHLLKATMRASNKVADPMLPVDQLVTHIRMQLGHSSKMVQQSALECLQSGAHPSAQAVLLRHIDCKVRFSAIELLGRARSPLAVEAVLKVISCSSFQARVAAAKTLAVASPIGYWPAVEGLAGLLEDRIREVRQAAVCALREVAVPDDPATVAVVLARVTHEDWPVRCAALETLAFVLQRDQDTVRRIAGQVRQSNSTVAKCFATRLLKTVLMNGTTSTHSAGKCQSSKLNLSSPQGNLWSDMSDEPSDRD